MNQPRVLSAVGTIQGIITAARIGLLHVLIQHQRQPQTQGCLERHRHQGVDHSIPRGLVEDGVGQEVGEVPEADEFPHLTDHAVGQR
jgi:hypothetical protein